MADPISYEEINNQLSALKTKTISALEKMGELIEIKRQYEEFAKQNSTTKTKRFHKKLADYREQLNKQVSPIPLENKVVLGLLGKESQSYLVWSYVFSSLCCCKKDVKKYPDLFARVARICIDEDYGDDFGVEFEEDEFLIDCANLFSLRVDKSSNFIEYVDDHFKEVVGKINS